MGYTTMLPEMLSAGSSMLTVHFVDEGHLLVTFGIRRLMKRETNDPPNDEDHVIAAFLVELPSGKVLARTEWRMHDRGQYLWNLGHGRFLLRVRNQLTMLQPMAAPTPEDAFHEYPFLHIERRIQAILLSPDADLLTIETADPPKPSNPDDSSATANPAPVVISFFRLANAGPAPDQLTIVSAGTVRSRVALALPLTAEGYLEVLEGGPNRWLFNFDAHGGKVSELAEFDTTCFPHTAFVSRSEFVAFGCRGDPDKQDIAGFNLNGDPMWQQNFTDTHVTPAFGFAPAAGRFALERTIVNGPASPGEILLPGDTSGQEVRVYQMYSGKLLLRTDCTPIVQAGQNFALSADGMSLAVLREVAVPHRATKDTDAYISHTAEVAIYPLPALTAKDQDAVKQAQAMAPEDKGERIDVALQRASAQAAAAASGSGTAAAADAAGGSSGSPSAPVPAPVPAADASQTVNQSPPPQPASSLAWGDPQPQPSRAPPTLYGPGETAPAQPR
jgi:hypothetical protein